MTEAALPPRLVVGVLAIQGDVAEHLAALAAAGALGRRVRRPEDLAGLAGLILPGGESTTIGMLGREVGLLEAIRARLGAGLPVWGTCAGLILLARDLGRDQPLIGGLDIRVERNAFGRQVDSFEVDLRLPFLEGGPFRAVFIRAPLVLQAGPAEPAPPHDRQVPGPLGKEGASLALQSMARPAERSLSRG